MHGPITNTGRRIKKEKIEGLALLDDLTLGKNFPETAKQFAHCLEELFIREDEVK